MKDVVLRLEKLSIAQFDPKQGNIRFKISCKKDAESFALEKSYTLEHPEPIVEDILRTVKQQGKMELEDADDLLGSIFVVRLQDEDLVEEKLLHFFSRLCEKMKMMKHLKNHVEYMKLFDEIKIKELRLS